ncbi:metallophosphoesterase [Rivibacter subsaxonicus]|uniref:Calcineurin-like phosphoesterase family protein n=1 Tax=Rivibacter subsaxonicus TaxID=457575 RepID=A0A4Q7VAF8_9BURK|nr:metallophosphoesterase [Rivibacter subsaxonicus]RZT92560.1 calcineurin-like phosphoesterase family protein [Rivibacter subsaxonicus]
MGYDLIGDIHGHAAKLDALLARLGYSRRGERWIPPTGRQAIFLGDLVDRGPQQIPVVRTVRAMVEAGDAQCVMGNHEFNAIGFVTERRGESGAFLRRHSAKNRTQHAEFLQQVGEGSALHLELIGWFRTLPPALDLGGIRVVHAWWHQPHVDLMTTRWPAGTSGSIRATASRGSRSGRFGAATGPRP